MANPIAPFIKAKSLRLFIVLMVAILVSLYVQRSLQSMLISPVASIGNVT